MTRAATEYEMYWNTIHRNVTDAATAQVEEKYIICNGPIWHERINKIQRQGLQATDKRFGSINLTTSYQKVVSLIYHAFTYRYNKSIINQFQM